MRIKVDEDLPKAVVELLQAQGHDAVGVIDQGMGGWKDADLWQVVQAEKRLLVTADKGFADTRSHPPGSHSGVVLVRPDLDGIRPTLELVERILVQYDLEVLAGTITVVTPRGVRIRREQR